MWQHKHPNSGNNGRTDSDKREYINVVADYLSDGTVRPVSIRFADGPAYAVAKIISVIHMSATKHNGAEIRYYVRIGDREHYLYFEDAAQNHTPRWFVSDREIISALRI